MTNREEHVHPADWPAAVADTEGPQLIVGGPGTGKTEFLVRRATHLITSDKAHPSQLLLLGFSRRGVAELRSRVEDALEESHVEVDASTFHSFAFRLLETHARSTLGWDRMPTTLTSLEHVLLVRRLLDAEDPAEWPGGLKGLLASTTLAEEVTDFILRCSEQLVEPEDLTGFGRDDWRALPGFISRYRRELHELGRIDYGTVVASAVRVLASPKALAETAAAYRYVLVDEYQDTTVAQARLLERLLAGGAGLTVAADPYQSIYSFRGADLHNVAAFPETFRRNDGSPAHRRVLTTSFRTPAAILDAAVRLTEGLDLPGAAGPVVAAGPGGAVRTFVFELATQEAEWIADEVQRLHVEDDVPLEAMAVFARSKRRFLPELSRTLERRGIPHSQPDSRLADHAAVRAVFDCVEAATAAEPGASGAVRRLLLGPLFRTPVAMLRGLERSISNTGTGWPEQIRRNVPDGHPLAGLLEDAAWATGRPAADGFWHVWEHLPQFGELVAVPERAEEREAWSSLSQVLSRLYERDPTASLADFVRWSNEETFEAQPLLEFRGRSGMLTLTTLHQSKGLEFDHVFIADAVEGVFPDLRTRESLLGTRHLSPHVPSDPIAYRRFRLQEETRLAYTAMSRARRQVTWSATTSREHEGRGGPSSLLLRVVAAPPAHPPPGSGLPTTPGQAEAWLRRMAADARNPEPRRRAAIHLLARGPEWGLRPIDTFAGVAAPGPDRGLISQPLRLSPSQADAYEACPRRYAIERRLHIREDTTVYLAFGKLLHRVLELTERAAQERGAEHGTLAGALATLEKVWEPADFGPSPYADAWFRRAAESLRLTYANWPRPAATPLALEHAMTLEIDGVTWRGQADRIEREGETVRVVDYKTGRSPVTQRDAKRSLQLGFYLLAARSDPAIAGHGLANEAELWMVAQDKKGAVPVLPFDPGNLEDVATRMRAVAEGIGNEDWSPTPHAGCDRCPVQLVCPAWPEGRPAYS